MSFLRYFPKSGADRCAFLFTFLAIHVIGFFELLVILPYIDADRTGYYWLHVTLGVYLYINIMAAWAYTIITDSRTSAAGKILPSVLKPGWRFCSSCEGNAPPRSFHCWTCDTCILRRDHHCSFTGNCVGYYNHRYFVTMASLLCIASMYCNYLNMDYTWETLGGFSLKSLFTMIMPLFSYLLGLAERYTFMVAFVSALCLFGFLLIGALVIYHGLNLYNGQLTHERSHNIKDYNLGWKENCRQVLGNNWIIAWMSPFIPSQLPGDGIEFAKSRHFENIKDL